MNIDALNRTTRLPRVEECTIDILGNCKRKICVVSNIGRVFAAKFCTHSNKAPDCGTLHCRTTIHRASEDNKVDALITNHFLNCCVAGMNMLKYARWETSRFTGLAESLCTQQSLRCVFHDNGIAS